MGVESSECDRIKGPWSPEEDEALRRLVDRHGARNWTAIGRGIPGRSGKSCRLRWCNQLSPQVEHRLTAKGVVQLRSLYVRPEAAAGMPAGCEVLEVTSLLRELILRATELPLEYDERGPAGRVMRLLLDELAALPRLPYNLPMPKTAPLAAICARLVEAPNDPATLEDLAARHGTTARTLARHFRRQTGMSFAEWRRRARLLRALGWIAEGRPILAVALDLGYDSPSAFSAMFRRELGSPPSHFRSAPA